MDINVKPPPAGVVALSGVFVGVEVRVAVAAGGCVPVGVRVGVAAGGCVDVGALEAKVTTSCGGLLPSRAENLTVSRLSPASTKLNVPLPASKDVMSYSTQVLLGMEPWLSAEPLV